MAGGLENKSIDIQTSSTIDYNKEIKERLEGILGDDYSFIEQDNDSLDVLDNLPEIDKKALIEYLNNKPEIANEILDNIPLSKEKIHKILIENKEKETVNQKKEKELEKEHSEQKREHTEQEIKQVEGNENQKIKELKETTQNLKSALNLENNPNYKSWQETAQKDLLASNPNLVKDPNLQSYIDAYILLQHQNKFLAERPDLKDTFTKLAENAGRIEVFKNIRIDKHIEENFSQTTIKREKEQLKASLLPNGENLHIDGREFKSGDQVVVLDKEEGVQRYIEKYGWRIQINVPFETGYKFQHGRDKIIGEYNTGKKEYEANTNKLISLETDIKKLDKEIEELSPITPENEMQIQTLVAEREQLLNDFNKLIQEREKIEQKIKTLEQQATEIQSSEEKRIGEFRERLNFADERARQSLEFINNIGLTNIPQSEFDKLMDKVNIAPGEYGFSQDFSLNNLGETRFTNDYYKFHKELINFYNKLLGLEGENAINPDRAGYYAEGRDQRFTSDQFKRTVVTTLYNEGSFRDNILNERFGANKEK